MKIKKSADWKQWQKLSKKGYTSKFREIEDISDGTQTEITTFSIFSVTGHGITLNPVKSGPKQFNVVQLKPN